MSEPPLEDDWAPAPAGDLRSGQFKWGWNAETGEAVGWSVSGPGDGWPFHQQFLGSAWGREASTGSGDRVGRAQHFAAGEAESIASELVVVESYYDAEVPKAVLEWFQREFPNAVVRASSGRRGGQ